MDSGNIVSWVQALLFLSAELFLNGVMRFVADRWKTPEWVSQTVIGVAGLLLGVCYWVRLPAGFAHNPIILLPFGILTLWLMQDVHSRNKVRLKIAGLESQLRTHEAVPAQREQPSAPSENWRQHPSKVTPETESQVALATGGPVIVKRLTTPLSVGAIGIFKGISIQQFKPGATTLFKCRCEIEFFGISVDKCSPAEIRLTNRGGTHLLATLEAQIVVACPGKMVYEGTGDWSELMKTAAAAWGRSEYKGPTPYEVQPPTQNLYCDVELRIPRGDSGQHHSESTVRLESEFDKNGIQPVTIKIDTWASFEAPSITLTPL